MSKKWRTLLLLSLAELLGMAVWFSARAVGPAPRFRWREVGGIMAHKGVSLANLGYLGHT